MIIRGFRGFGAEKSRENGDPVGNKTQHLETGELLKSLASGCQKTLMSKLYHQIVLVPAAHGMGAPKASRGDRECVPRPRSPFVPSKEAKNLTQRRKVRNMSGNPETTRIHPAAQLCNLQCSIANLVPWWYPTPASPFDVLVNSHNYG